MTRSSGLHGRKDDTEKMDDRLSGKRQPAAVACPTSSQPLSSDPQAPYEESKMRKSFIALSLSMAVVSGHALADISTFNALASAGIPMTAEQAATLKGADAGSSQLEEAVTAVIKAATAGAKPSMAVTVTTAAVNAVPALQATVCKAGISGAPAQEAAIRASKACSKNVTDTVVGSGATNIGATINTNGIPSVSGSGGSSRVASPN